MEITEIVCEGDEVLLIYYNIFISKRVYILDGRIHVIVCEIGSGKDLSVDLKSLFRDIKMFEADIYRRLNNAKAEDKDIKENTATFYRAIADNFKKKHEILSQIVNGGEKEIPQILLTPIKIKIF